MSTKSYTEESLRELLPLYYGRLFPYHSFYRWLSYGNDDPKLFQNREFSFTLADDIYVRYQSFRNEIDMAEIIQKKNPFKIDIGAIYSSAVKDFVRGTMVPKERELVFDIDMTDYDEVRTCCQGADICTKCWKYMAIACKVLDVAIRDDFGYEHLLWVFSGRRGIHCWVCDKEARQLDSNSRKTLVNYLTLVAGGNNQEKKVKMLDGEKMHSSVKRAMNIIEPLFIRMAVEEQDMLGTDTQVKKLLALLPEEMDGNELKTKLSSLATSCERWDAVVDQFKGLQQKGLIKKWHNHALEEIMLQFTYPRLDINVSTGLNHLLKAPFCIHPKTGKVCTPFNPKAVDKFDPSKVPTITKLADEVNEFDRKDQEFNDKEKENLMNLSDIPVEAKTDQESLEVRMANEALKRMKDYKKTSMYKSIVVFEEFVKKLEDSRKDARDNSIEMKMEF